jgi:V/A-type H+-transporting ATPase subunit E
MKNLENRQEKLQKISDELKAKALEPAQKEATQILADAKREANDIINEAKKQADQLLEKALKDIKQERSVFDSSISQASKQSIEALKLSIEDKFFSNELEKLVKEATSDKEVIAKLINAIVGAIEKQGLEADLSAVIPRAVSTDEVNALLGKHILSKLQNQTVEVGNIDGGVLVKLKGKHLTIDMSDKSLKELLANYVRKDFRKHLFGSI